MDATNYLDNFHDESYDLCTAEALGGNLSNADVQRELLLLPQVIFITNVLIKEC